MRIQFTRHERKTMINRQTPTPLQDVSIKQQFRVDDPVQRRALRLSSRALKFARFDIYWICRVLHVLKRGKRKTTNATRERRVVAHKITSSSLINTSGFKLGAYIESRIPYTRRKWKEKMDVCAAKGEKKKTIVVTHVPINKYIYNNRRSLLLDPDYANKTKS